MRFPALRLFAIFSIPAKLIFIQSAYGQTKEGCREKTLVFPPAVHDAALGVWLAREASSALKDSAVLKCFQTVESEAARETLSFIGFSVYRKITIDDLGSKQLEILHEDLGINQIMLLAYTKGKDPTLVANVYKFFRDEDGDFVARPFHKLRITFDRKEVAKRRSNVMNRYIPFFAPNIVTLGSTSSSLSIEPVDEYLELSTKVKSTIPAIISSVSIGHIPHPDAFGSFEFDFRFDPRFRLFSIDQTTTIEKRAEYADNDLPQTKVLNLKATGACTALEGTGSLHWPLGNTYLALGFGPCLYGVQREDEEMSILPDLGLHFKLGHSFFITRQVFAYFESGTIGFSKQLYKNEFATSSSTLSSAIGIGYYFTNVENRFAKAW